MKHCEGFSALYASTFFRFCQIKISNVQSNIQSSNIFIAHQNLSGKICAFSQVSFQGVLITQCQNILTTLCLNIFQSLIYTHFEVCWSLKKKKNIIKTTPLFLQRQLIPIHKLLFPAPNVLAFPIRKPIPFFVHGMQL